MTITDQTKSAMIAAFDKGEAERKKEMQELIDALVDELDSVYIASNGREYLTSYIRENFTTSIMNI